MQAIQSVKPALTPNYSLQKRKPASSNISMTGRKPETSGTGNIKKKVVLATAALALVALATGVAKFIKTKRYEDSMLKLIFTADNVQIGRGNNALRMRNGKIVERVLKPRTTKASEKAKAAQAAINEGLKGYQYVRPASAGYQTSSVGLERFLRRYT